VTRLLFRSTGDFANLMLMRLVVRRPLAEHERRVCKPSETGSYSKCHFVKTAS
jgi:hypothetical protein